jgi:hypothetical protein
VLKSIKILKRISYLEALKDAIPIIKEKLNWIPRNGKNVRIWKDNIYEMENLSIIEDLAPLKAWMDSRNIQTLYDVS